MTLDPTSILFVTLDSCRFDTFVEASAPNLKSVGRLYRAKAPGYFTYSSHAAMFVGFTPGVADLEERYANPKFTKIFKILDGGSEPTGGEFALLRGQTIMCGLRAIGYGVVGTGAVGWFNTDVPTGRALTADFDRFLYTEGEGSLGRQLDFLQGALDEQAAADRPVFAFLNVGETHVPYHFEGAPWGRSVNPCVPYSPANDAGECRRRQRACLEYADRQLENLLDRFAGANVIVCADHGDAWGEDGLWEHGIHHPAVLDVPLVYRLDHPPRGSPK